MRARRFVMHPNRRFFAMTLTLATLIVAGGCSQSTTPARDGIEQMPVAESHVDSDSTDAPTGSTMPPTSPDPASSTDSKSTTAVTVRPTPRPAIESKPAVGSESKAKRVEFAPHIVIDWSIPRVEIEAEVALSDGLIELLLCGRGTKEHESILVTGATAKRVFEAMGLIGLSPGAPVQYDEATESFLPPRGDRVVVEIEYSNRVVGAHEWMRETKTDSPANPISWVFAGSRDVAGRFGANDDGTIVCVVNFDTALIAPNALHSSDDSALWLGVNEQRVPSVGAKCRVFIRAATDADTARQAGRSIATTEKDPNAADAGKSETSKTEVSGTEKADADTGPMRLIVTPEGNFHWGDELLTPVELDGVIRERIEQNPDQPVHLSAIPGTDARLARVAARCIVGSGIKQSNLTLELPDDATSSSESSDE